MNLWVLDTVPVTAAQYHTDRHVSGAIGEIAQMLVMAHIHWDGWEEAHKHVPFVPLRWRLAGNPDCYSIRDLTRSAELSHATHPVAVWVRENSSNYEWAAALLNALIAQELIRFNRSHEWTRMAVTWRMFQPLKMPFALDRSPFVESMPMEFKKQDAVEAYRDYYFSRKQSMAKWSVVGMPKWWKDMIGKEVRCG